VVGGVAWDRTIWAQVNQFCMAYCTASDEEPAFADRFSAQLYTRDVESVAVEVRVSAFVADYEELRDDHLFTVSSLEGSFSSRLWAGFPRQIVMITASARTGNSAFAGRLCAGCTDLLFLLVSRRS
jgi:hypothetical protein